MASCGVGQVKERYAAGVNQFSHETAVGGFPNSSLAVNLLK